MKIFKYIFYSFISFMILSCDIQEEKLVVEVYETSKSGNKLTKLEDYSVEVNSDLLSKVVLKPTEERQTITGFGGSFTESTAYLLNKLSTANRAKIIEAYFGESGAKYSLTRTHMNSCDFSLSQYSYAPVEGDKTLEHFSIEEDKDDIIPMIKDAMKVSKDGFKILSSPWTASPWMKDNNNWVGGKLLPEYYDNDGMLDTKITRQPPLEKRNPNKESLDFAILLKINDSDKLKKQIIKTFQSLPINKKLKLDFIEKKYKKYMPVNWKNNLKDLIYFL